MKRLCVLEQSGTIHDPITKEKKALFNTELSDYRRLNWRHTDDPDADLTAPGVVWSEGRSLLYESVRDAYDYYLFMDDDIVFEHDGHDLVNIIVELLDDYNPFSASFYCQKLWGHNPISPEMNKRKPAYPFLCVDLQLTIYSRQLASIVFPVPFHGSDCCMWYAFWLANKINPGKQVCFSGVTVRNTRSVPHGNQEIRSTREALVKLFNRLTNDHSFDWTIPQCKEKNRLLFESDIDSSTGCIDHSRLNDLVNWNHHYLKFRAAKRNLFHKLIVESQIRRLQRSQS